MSTKGEETVPLIDAVNTEGKSGESSDNLITPPNALLNRSYSYDPSMPRTQPPGDNSAVVEDSTLGEPFPFYEKLRKTIDPLTEKLIANSKWLQHHWKHFLIGLFVALLVLSFVETVRISFLRSVFYLKEIDGSQQTSVAALKAFVERLEAKQRDTVTVDEIVAGALQTGKPWTVLGRNFILVITDLFWDWWNSLTSIIPYCYAVFDKLISPAIAIWTTLNIGELLSDTRSRQQELERHKEARYPETVILGWNLFERIYDENGNLIGMDFTIPTEDVFPLNDIVSFDPVLSAKLSDKATAPYLARNSIDYPDFAIGMDTKDEQIQVNRGAGNKISSVFLKFASQAKSFKADPKLKENPIYILTCEKTSSTQKIPTEHSRIWLIYPSELRMLLQYEKEINDEKSTFFKFGRPNWRLRIQNLLLWAKAEFLTPSPKKYICGEVFLPREPQDSSSR